MILNYLKMCNLIKYKINHNLLNIIRNYLTRSKVEYKKNIFRYNYK